MLREAHLILDQAFSIMLRMGRKLYAEQASATGEGTRPKLLVVDNEQEFLRDLARLLADKPWDTAAEITGGGALDDAGNQNFDVIICREELPDLRGSMIIKTVQAQNTETLGVVYSTADGDGQIDIYRWGRIDSTHRPFSAAAQLAEKLEGIVAEISSAQQDRRIIQSFRNAHQDFFRRYGELRMRLNRILE